VRLVQVQFAFHLRENRRAPGFHDHRSELLKHAGAVRVPPCPRSFAREVEAVQIPTFEGRRPTFEGRRQRRNERTRRRKRRRRRAREGPGKLEPVRERTVK